MPRPELTEQESRLLVVVYDLADGSTAPVPDDDIRARAEELQLFAMTPEEFMYYRARVLERVAAARKVLH